jgi:hypothetical protein
LLRHDSWNERDHLARAGGRQVCLIRVCVARGGAGARTVETPALVADPERGRCRDRDRASEPEVPNGRSGLGDGDRRDITTTACGHVFSPVS